MERVAVNGGTLEYEARGTGEPVLLIHGSILADAFAPLTAEPAIAGRYQLISYHRRGFAGSSRASGPVSIAQQAADARAIMRRVGIDRAHVVGHSYGGVIALQLARDTPDAVHSLALLEPALMMVPSAEQFFTALAPVMEAYSTGKVAEAVDGFLSGVGGPEYRVAMERTLPSDWFALAVADADTFFQVELPALQEWQFTEELAHRISQPVLAVLGANSPTVAPLFAEGNELLRAWLPQSEGFLLPAATHPLQIQNPRGMAEGLAAFLVRHPLPVPA